MLKIKEVSTLRSLLVFMALCEKGSLGVREARGWEGSTYLDGQHNPEIQPN